MGNRTTFDALGYVCHSIKVISSNIFNELTRANTLGKWCVWLKFTSKIDNNIKDPLCNGSDGLSDIYGTRMALK